MQRFPAFPGAVMALTFALLVSACCDAVERREPFPKPPLATHAKPPLPTAIDSKAKLISFNRDLTEQLKHTRSSLGPLQTSAAKLQRRYQSTHTRSPSAGSPGRLRSERNGLLKDALQLRAAVERKLVGFGALDRSYRNMRMLAGSRGAGGSSVGGLPRGWLDRDTERQMELNERIYKNIIDLLVHLIECPVNIIHDMMGPSTPATPSTSTTTTAGPDEVPPQDYTDPDYTALADDADSGTNLVFDVDGAEGDAGEPWLEEFHY